MVETQMARAGIVKLGTVRPLINLVETCLIVGSVFFATGLLGEQIAVQRAELRELRRRLEETQARALDDDAR